MKVKWYLPEETKSLASLTTNQEHDLQLLSLEFGYPLQKNKCANTFEIQNGYFNDSILYYKYNVVLKVNWPQSLIISLSKWFMKYLLSSVVSMTVLAKLRWSLNCL